MSESPPPAGLCATCVHSRVIESKRGSVFRLCQRSETDSRFPKYPKLPVRECDGFEDAGKEERV
jgi:hypothetical protein